MAAGTLYYESTLLNYVLGSSEKNLSRAMKDDILVKFVKHEIEHRRCPFCGSIFTTRMGIISHLKHGRCAEELSEFVKLTVNRYMLLRHDKLGKKLARVIE